MTNSLQQTLLRYYLMTTKLYKENWINKKVRKLMSYYSKLVMSNGQSKSSIPWLSNNCFFSLKVFRYSILCIFVVGTIMICKKMKRRTLQRTGEPGRVVSTHSVCCCLHWGVLLKRDREYFIAFAEYNTHVSSLELL